MPLALYTIKDFRAVRDFCHFHLLGVGRCCSIPRSGLPAVRKEWINVARTLEVGTVRRAFNRDHCRRGARRF